MNKSTKILCRTGIIAALYVALTYAFGTLSFQGFLQIRPAEALTILPLFFPEAIPALFIGCAISNIISVYTIYDVIFGSLATLLAAFLTYLMGRIFKNTVAKITLGGLFPVIINALVIPLIIVFLCGDRTKDTALLTYLFYAGSMFLTEAIWVYALGTPLYLSIDKLRKKNVPFFL